jgi:hypothetical protein
MDRPSKYHGYSSKYHGSRRAQGAGSGTDPGSLGIPPRPRTGTVTAITVFNEPRAPDRDLIGLDHERLTDCYPGRDVRLTDVAGRVVNEILA